MSKKNKTYFLSLFLLFSGCQTANISHSTTNEFDNNIVYLMSINGKNNDVIGATGSILNKKDSSGHNYILTAKHVLWRNHGNYKKTIFAVANQKGEIIAQASPYIISNNQSDPTKEKGFMEQDMAILKISLHSKKYDAINGLKISQNYINRPSYIFVNTPFGIEKGASGAPVLDKNNAIIGIVSNIYNNSSHTVKNTSLNLYETINNNKAIQTTSSYPDKDYVYIAPFNSKIISFLKMQKNTNESENTNLTIPAYSQDQPIIFKTNKISKYPNNGIKGVDENHTNMDLEAILLMRKNGIINLGEANLKVPDSVLQQ